MTIILAEKIPGGVKLPDDFPIPACVESFCDGEFYYFFETIEERDRFYQEKGI